LEALEKLSLGSKLVDLRQQIEAVGPYLHLKALEKIMDKHAGAVFELGRTAE
jgi:hypothetical protein